MHPAQPEELADLVLADRQLEAAIARQPNLRQPPVHFQEQMRYAFVRGVAAQANDVVEGAVAGVPLSFGHGLMNGFKTTEAAGVDRNDTGQGEDLRLIADGRAVREAAGHIAGEKQVEDLAPAAGQHPGFASPPIEDEEHPLDLWCWFEALCEHHPIGPKIAHGALFEVGQLGFNEQPA